MTKRKHASDWIQIREDLFYSEELSLYFYKGRHYDHRSASHNGLIGIGFQLKEMIKGINCE